jgi:hypothetical protein
VGRLGFCGSVGRTGGWTSRIARAVPKPARKTITRKPPKPLLRSYIAHSRSIRTTGRVHQTTGHELPAGLTLNYCDAYLSGHVREEGPILVDETNHAPVCCKIQDGTASAVLSASSQHNDNTRTPVTLSASWIIINELTHNAGVSRVELMAVTPEPSNTVQYREVSVLCIS